MTKILIGRGDTDLDYPICRPSLDLDFTQEELDPRITFTRGSIGTRVNRNRVIETVAANQPRFDYDPVTGECKGLLIEESRSNLVTDNATNFNYGINNQIIATENDVAPDGTTVLCKHNLTGANFPFLNCRVNTTLSAGNTYTMSMWLKGTTNFSASFAFVGETTGEIPNTSINVTTDWKRFTLTFTLVATQTSSRLQVFFARQGEAKIISIWGVQLEQGAFATSYIPRNSGQQSTRSADLASMTGTNFSSWYNQSEGTLYAAARVNALGSSGYPGITYVDDGTTDNSIGFYVNDVAGDVIGAEAYVSGRVQYGLASSSAAIPNQLNKVISSYSTNNFSASFNTSSRVERDISGSIPTVNRLRIGTLRGGVYPLNGTISRLTYYPRALKPNQLQLLTQ
jgi:hypothetical protein